MQLKLLEFVPISYFNCVSFPQFCPDVSFKSIVTGICSNPNGARPEEAPVVYFILRTSKHHGVGSHETCRFQNPWAPCPAQLSWP